MERGTEQEHIDKPVLPAHNFEKASEGDIVIENTPPYFDELRPLLDVPVETVIKESRQFEKPYIAFQAVRHAGAGYTGFEPYLLGNGSTEMIPSTLLDFGKNSLRTLDRDPKMKQMVVQTLREEHIYLPALRWLNAELGSLTARLRAQTILHKEASDFKSDVYSKIQERSINYTLNGKETKQRYILPRIVVSVTNTIPSMSTGVFITPHEFLKLLGKVGHPLVRASLRHLPNI